VTLMVSWWQCLSKENFDFYKRRKEKRIDSKTTWLPEGPWLPGAGISAHFWFWAPPVTVTGARWAVAETLNWALSNGTRTCKRETVHIITHDTKSTVKCLLEAKRIAREKSIG
jgi:hypothetical protein